MTEAEVLKKRLLATVLAIPIALVLGEIAARLWVAARYTPERVEQLTHHESVRGRFGSHPNLPFALNPDFRGHNSLGFRGKPFDAAKPAGTRRLACIGASTTYGSLDDAEDSYPAELEKLMKARPERWEVINAGVPGWVSSEMLVQLELRVLPLEPEIVVILLSRNEIFPQTYNDFRPDYTHYRRPGFNFAVSNFAHKEVFKWSRLAMLACTVGGDRFGWSETAEHPLYGGILWENQPSQAEAEAHILDPARMAPLRRNLEAMIAVCRQAGVGVLLCTMPVRPEKFTLDELERRTELRAPLGRLIARNNEVGVEVATRLGVPVADTAQLERQEALFLDDSHLTTEGHRLEARIVYDALVPLLGAQ